MKPKPPARPLSSPLAPQTNMKPPEVDLGPSPGLGKFGPGRPASFDGTPVLVQKDGGQRSTITFKK